MGSQLLVAPKVTQCYQSMYVSLLRRWRDEKELWCQSGNREQPAGRESERHASRLLWSPCTVYNVHCITYTFHCVLYQPAVPCSWVLPGVPLLLSFHPSSTQLMHFLLAVCSAAKQEKTPDDILGAAIRRFCSRLQRKFLIGGRQQLDLDFLVNKWDTALPPLEVQLKISFIAVC